MREVGLGGPAFLLFNFLIETGPLRLKTVAPVAKPFRLLGESFLAELLPLSMPLRAIVHPSSCIVLETLSIVLWYVHVESS